MADVKIPGGFITMPDALDQYVMVNGKRVYFEFSKWMGPTVVDNDGEPRQRQPGERNPFWPAFKVWLDRWWALQPYAFWVASADGKPLHHWRETNTGWESRCGRKIGHALDWNSTLQKSRTKCAACLALMPEQGGASP